MMDWITMINCIERDTGYWELKYNATFQLYKSIYSTLNNMTNSKFCKIGLQK